jgi:hypothetical protein
MKRVASANHPVGTRHPHLLAHAALLAFAYYFTQDPHTASLKIPVLLCCYSGTFHDGKPAFFGHTAGDGWN